MYTSRSARGGRATSRIARHGHHYTHMWYSLNASTLAIARLSNEFCFSSLVAPATPSDAPAAAVGGGTLRGGCDLIQYAGGLSLLGPPATPTHALISYGINDCESSALRLPLGRVLSALQPLGDAKHEGYLMQPLAQPQRFLAEQALA